MESQGSEISVKIRSAIKAKLVELGAYVDEELPDYVMVMIANKKSKQQMTDDLQLFLGKHSEAFTTWLHDVLDRLQSISSSIKEELRPHSRVDRSKKSPPPKSSKSHGGDVKRKQPVRRDSSVDSSSSRDTFDGDSRHRKPSDRHKNHRGNVKEKHTSAATRRQHTDSRDNRHADKHSSSKRTRRKSSSSRSRSSRSESEEESTRHSTSKPIVSKKTESLPKPPVRQQVVVPVKPEETHDDLDEPEEVLDIHADGIQAFSEAYISEPEESYVHQEMVRDKRSHPRIEPPTNVVRPLKRSPPQEQEKPRLSKSVVAQVVSRDAIPEDEYDPTRPQIGSVASVIKVSGRKPPKESGAKPNLFLKAIKQANDSVVKTKRKSSEADKQDREPLELFTKKRRLQDDSDSGVEEKRKPRVKEVKPLRIKEEKPRKSERRREKEAKSERRSAETDSRNVENDTRTTETKSTRPVHLRRKFTPDSRRVEPKIEPEEEMLVVDQSVSTTTRFVVTLTGTGEELKPVAITSRTALMQQGAQLQAAKKKPTAPENGSAGSSPNQSTITTSDLVIPQAQTLRIDLSDEEEDEMDNSNVLTDMSNDNELDMSDNPYRSADPLVSPQEGIERCRFYPGCREGDKCPFLHPSFPCKAFPNCFFGDKCRYVHPSCKFDAHCKNPKCPYAHSSPRVVPNNSYNSKTSIPCRFAEGCRNRNCPFKHSTKPPCMYGKSCTKMNCTFSHPKVPPKMAPQKVDVAKFKWTSSKSAINTPTSAPVNQPQTVGYNT